MKILQLIQKPQLRGAEIFAAQLSEELVSLGNEVLLVSLFKGDAELPFSGIQYCLDANPGNRLWDKTAWAKLAGLIRKFQPDIVQANAGDTLKYAGLSRFFFRWNSKLIFRNANLISGFVDAKPKQLFNQFLLRQYDGVASVSQLCMLDFQKVFLWNKPIVHLPIGVETQEISSPSIPRDIQVWLGDSPFLIHIGSFVPEKNHVALLRIFEQLQVDFPQFKLVLCGEGPLMKEVSSDLPKSVLAAGARGDVLAILAHAEALLLPSLIEGLPGVILEAMALNIPVVAYDTGGISEPIRSGSTGYLVEKGNEEQFVQVVREMLSKPDLQKQIKKNAFQLVHQDYKLEKVSLDFLDFYQSLLDR